MGMMEREVAVAAPGAATTGAAGSIGIREWLTFRLGGEEFAIDILKVQEIRGYEIATTIVGAPPFVKGVLNLRGVVVPIVDLHLKFGLDQANFDALTVTVILNLNNRVVGAVVDAVSDVIELAAGQIKPAPQMNGTSDANFITGIGVLEQDEQERMLILIDIEQLMASSDIGLA